MVKRFLPRIILFLVALAFLAVTVLYFFQDLLIFQTVSLDADHTYTFDQPFKEYFIPVPASNTSPTETLNALWFKSSGPSKGLILYFHGNRGNLQRWGTYAVDFTVHGYDVLMIDYRGYGKSTGKPSEEALYADALTVHKWAQAMGSYPRLIIYGRSLGSAVASRLAMDVQPDLLILETPFDELSGVIHPFWQPLAKLLPIRSVFSNTNHLPGVRSRKVIFHGTDDHIVPLSSAVRLLPLLDSPNDFVIIPKGGHRNLRSFPEFQVKVAALLDSL